MTKKLQVVMGPNENESLQLHADLWDARSLAIQPVWLTSTKYKHQKMKLAIFS